VAQSLYRICQEALNNALKHASASEVLVRLAVEGDVVTLDVLDNGIGFVLDDARTSPGLGLAYIRERAEHLNAELTIDTEPDHGTHVRVALVVPQLTAAMAKTDIATSN
jgi:signal transduction histidine kinase